MSILGASAHSLNRPDGEMQAAPAATTGPLVILNWAQFYNFTADEWRMTILAILHEIKTECRMILIFCVESKNQGKTSSKMNTYQRFLQIKNHRSKRVTNIPFKFVLMKHTHYNRRFRSIWGMNAWPTQRWALNIYIWFIWREKIFGFPQNSSTDDV